MMAAALTAVPDYDRRPDAGSCECPLCLRDKEIAALRRAMAEAAGFIRETVDPATFASDTDPHDWLAKHWPDAP